MKVLDDRNRKILQILQEDAKLSIKEIAKRINLSFTPTYERIRQMEDSGVIARYGAFINREKVGLKISALCNIMLKEQSEKALMEFEKAVTGIPEIVSVISVSGGFDYMLKILAVDIENYNNFMVKTIANLPNIGNYHSSIILSEVKKESVIPIPDLTRQS